MSTAAAPEALCLTQEQICQDHVFTAGLSEEEICELIFSLDDPGQAEIDALIEAFGVHTEDYLGPCDGVFEELCLEDCFEVKIILDGEEVDSFGECDVKPLQENLAELDEEIIVPSIFLFCLFDEALRCQEALFEQQLCVEQCQGVECECQFCYEETCDVVVTSSIEEVDCPELECDDGIDNDEDGLTDCDDGDCEEDDACIAIPPGPEPIP
jgi:hypothetical protein